MKKAIIIGATGYGGLGLIEILLKHPAIEIKQLIARRDACAPISNVFPHLKGFCDITVERPENIDFSDVDIVFFSTPDRVGMTIINDFFDKKIPVVDFSGDFRFNNVEEYSTYARFKGMDEEHLSPHVLEYSVYGLPEIYKERIKNARIIGNPGCFAISMILGLLPAVEMGIIDSDTIICDGKTGVSGAGKNPGEANYYPARYENVNTYREGRHQHIIEVENIINSQRGRLPKDKTELKILFTPQIVPLNRGILTTIYADINEPCKTKRLQDVFRDYYSKSPFVMITDKSPNTTNVRGTNRCEIRPVVDERTGKLFITSIIDNLVKGQSGNAVQNANIILGLDERTGLDHSSFYP